MALIAVAAVSARMMTEAAACDGFEVIALDLFGDADTRLASLEWQPLNQPGALHIDESRTLAALRALTRRGGVSGWIAGSGFEGLPELLDKAASLLPMIGTSPEAIARVRNPMQFFGFLDSRGIEHPPVRLGQTNDRIDEFQATPLAWLIKNARGCGGWHVRRDTRHDGLALPEHHYRQQEVEGVPMSATFIGNGHEALVLGFNEQLVNSFGTHPFVFCGAVGPVSIAPQAASQVRAAVDALTAEFALRGLCSLDFMCHGSQIAVLEVNPRPPASMALYASYRFEPGGTGILAAHVHACQYGELPRAAGASQPGRVEGFEIVFAPHAVRIDDFVAARFVAWPNCHDLPCSGTHIETGDPVCSLSASADTADDVKAALRNAREALLESLRPRT